MDTDPEEERRGEERGRGGEDYLAEFSPLRKLHSGVPCTFAKGPRTGRWEGSPSGVNLEGRRGIRAQGQADADA